MATPVKEPKTAVRRPDESLLKKNIIPIQDKIIECINKCM